MATKRKSAATAAPAAAPVAEVAAPDTSSGAEVILRTNFAQVEQDSVALLHAASLLIEADTPEKVSFALDHNLKLWVAIKTVLVNDECPLEPEVKANLRNLAHYVTTTTMEATNGTIEARRLVSLARVNMNISEGLLRGGQNKLIAERAYEIWEQEGCPEGRDQEHWLRAEAEITGKLQG